MSDECLMKQETAFPFYTQYQAVMWKFTLADISIGPCGQGIVQYCKQSNKTSNNIIYTIVNNP